MVERHTCNMDVVSSNLTGSLVNQQINGENKYMTWKTLESCVALCSNIARDYLKYKTSDTNEKKALEKDIEANPQNFTDTPFAQEATDNNTEFNNKAFTELEQNIKQNPEAFVNNESEAISEEASQLLDNDKRNDEVSEDMYVKIRQEENEDWKNKLIEKYNSQSQYEMPEDLFSDLEEEDLDYAIQMIDDLVFGEEAGKAENLDDWIEQAQADDAYAMGVEENNYLPPEEFKQVGAFLGGNPAEVKDEITDVEYNIRDAEETVPEDVNVVEEDGEPIEETEEDEESKKSKRRNNFLDKLKRSISINPANGSFKAEETDTTSDTKGGAVGQGIGSNINGQSGGVGVNANLGGNSPEKNQELEEYKEQRAIDSELHYDDVPVEQMSSVNNPGANNGNTDEEKHNINVPKTNSNFTVKKNELKGHTGHKYGKNNIELDEVETNNTDELEEILKSLGDYSMFEPLVIENINNEILVDGSPLKMTSEETLKYIQKVLNEEIV